MSVRAASDVLPADVTTTTLVDPTATTVPAGVTTTVAPSVTPTTAAPVPTTVAGLPTPTTTPAVTATTVAPVATTIATVPKPAGLTTATTLKLPAAGPFAVASPTTTAAPAPVVPGLVVNFPDMTRLDVRMLDAVPAALDYGQIADSFAMYGQAVPTPLLAPFFGKPFTVRSSSDTVTAQEMFNQLASEKGGTVRITLTTTAAPGSALLAQLVKTQLEQLKNIFPVTVVSA